MIRKKRKFVKPKKSFELSRIQEENSLVEKYGLKNKREIWKTLAKVNYFRKRAMELARASLEEQEVLFNKLRALGLKIEGTADVLDLKPIDLLERRLPTVIAKKGLAQTPKHGRQLVTHKKVLIKGNAIDSPSYLVSLSEENEITLNQKAKKPKPKPIEVQTEEKPIEKVKEEEK
jgi:small subunit ribosomal protein S4